MDRFIGIYISSPSDNFADLKSNMDRFIGCSVCGNEVTINNLKSNMDRFIEVRLDRYKDL